MKVHKCYFFLCLTIHSLLFSIVFAQDNQIVLDPDTNTGIDSESSQDCSSDRFFLAAQIFASQDNLEEFREMLLDRLAEADSAVCILEALKIEAISAEEPSTFETTVTSLESIFQSLLPTLLVGVIVSTLFYFRKAASHFYRKRANIDWRVNYIGEPDKLDIVKEWQSALADPIALETSSSGLFGASSLAPPDGVALRVPGSSGSSSLIKTAPEIQGLKTSWLLDVLMWLWRKSSSRRRTIITSVRYGEKFASFRIEVVDSCGVRKSSSDTISWDSEEQSPMKAKQLASNMAIRTAYMINPDSYEIPSEVRIKLGEGVTQLNAYLEGLETESLESAIRLFSDARKVDPLNLHTMVYEGIARELHEDHIGAAALFQRVIESSNNNLELKTRAIYNLSISHLRKYSVDSLKTAETLLAGTEGLIKSEHTTPMEMRFLAKAALANVTAHKFIFWLEIPPACSGEYSSWTREMQKAKKEQLEGWLNLVNQISNDVEAAVSDESTFPQNQQYTIQLKWLMANAMGNTFLNVAKYACGPLHFNSSKKIDYLNQALEKFKFCEVLIPAGTETLTNIATVLLSLDRPKEAIRYTQSARTLNPRYEYAYYREAEALVKTGDLDSAKEFLTHSYEMLKKISIPSFKKLFEDLEAS